MLRRIVAAAVSGMLAVASAVAQPAGLSVVQRQPGAADGPPAYRQDMHWLDPAGQSWAMREVGDGRAAWLYQDPAASVIDQIGGSRPAAAYGTRRLTVSYAGPAFRVIRGNDVTTSDIGFLPDGRLDESALAALCARAECRVARWYDQSGNRNDAVQPVRTAQPVVRLAHRTGNSVSITWDYEAGSGAAARALVLPRSLSVDSANMGLLWTGRFHNASIISPLIELGVDRNAFNFGFWDAHGDFYLGTPGQLNEMPGHASLSAGIGLISSSPGEGVVTNYRNREVTLGALRPQAHNGGYIGKSVIYGQDGMMELSSLIIYDRALTPADRFFGLQAAGENFDIAQQQQDTYVADGDSLTQGLASSYLQSYSWFMEKLLPRSLVLYDAGWAAKTLDGPGGLLDRYGGFTSRLYNPNASNNVISLLAGTNDIQNGSNGQQVARLVRQYAEKARQTGFKVIVCTILPRASFTAQMEAQRKTANTMIRAGWQDFADGLADVAADPKLGAANAPANTDVYAADGVHLTDFGYQLVGRDMADVVNRLLH